MLHHPGSHVPHILSQYWQPLGLKVKYYHWTSFQERKASPFSLTSQVSELITNRQGQCDVGIWQDHYFAKIWLLSHQTLQNALEELFKPLEIKGWLKLLRQVYTVLWTGHSQRNMPSSTHSSFTTLTVVQLWWLLQDWNPKNQTVMWL